jgi:hypothetical protein
MTQNWFATTVLLLWPFFVLWLFQTRPINQATLWSILGAQLLLPVGASIKVAQGIPVFDKVSIPNLTCLVACILLAKRPLRFWNRFGLAEVLLLASCIGPFITSELNGDLIHVSDNVTLPSVGNYDALSAVVSQMILLIPFFLGRQYLRDMVDNEAIMRALVIAGLLYSIPILFELRMSPQLHIWIYGFDPGVFYQEVRDGGFRPVVFMGHGLMVSFFMMTTVVAAVALWRTRASVRNLPPGGVAAYLSIILILCKSSAALLYGGASAILVRFTKPRLQLRIALVLAVIGLLYPILRTADFIPTAAMIEAAKLISTDRADSLSTRFEQEDQLLKHASDRFVFGWGRFGRNRVFDANSGRDITITDGHWINTLGQFGLFGFLVEFGLLTLPVFHAASAYRFTDSVRDKVYLAALSLILAVNIIDLLPNSTITPWTWLVAGTLLGRAEALRTAAGRHQPALNKLAPATLGGSSSGLRTPLPDENLRT